MDGTPIDVIRFVHLVPGKGVAPAGNSMSMGVPRMVAMVISLTRGWAHVSTNLAASGRVARSRGWAGWQPSDGVAVLVGVDVGVRDLIRGDPGSDIPGCAITRGNWVEVPGARYRTTERCIDYGGTRVPGARWGGERVPRGHYTSEVDVIGNC